MRLIEEIEADESVSTSSLKQNILSISDNFHEARRTMRVNCPACGCQNYNFAFDKNFFHYVRCHVCSSLYVQNPLADESFDQYLEEIQDCFHKPVIQAELELKSSRRFFTFEVIISRRFDTSEDVKIAYHGRYTPLLNLLKKQFPNFEITPFDEEKSDYYHMVLYDNLIGNSRNPARRLNQVYQSIQKDGWLCMTTRLGSGLDILLLGQSSNIIPTENLNLFSKEGIEALLEPQFKIKELSTPGTQDVKMILEGSGGNLPDFVQYLQKHRGSAIVEDFQEFVQKNLLSSYLLLLGQKKDAS